MNKDKLYVSIFFWLTLAMLSKQRTTDPEVLIASRHSGGRSELINALGLQNIEHDVYDIESCPKCSQIGMKRKAAYEVIKSGLVRCICNAYKLIILSDHIPNGRAFLQASPCICFNNWYAAEFVELFKALVTNPNIFFSCNNDYEEENLRQKGIILPRERTINIKPFGINYIERDDRKGFPDKAALRRGSQFNELFYELLENKNFNKSRYDVLPQSYGGPEVLKEYNFYIYIPYQFSTMKTYENVNNGVLTAIPTKNYYKQIVQMVKKRGASEFALDDMIKVMKLYPEDWYKFVDAYDSKNEGCFIEFDSLDELIQLINGEKKFDAEFHQRRMKEVMQKQSLESYQKWNDLFKLIGIN